ncbi:antibiotic biosynthesis monooxygenase, partial [Mesorhizobium sp. M2D.F.Ca.ET.145.01.1.1]
MSVTNQNVNGSSVFRVDKFVVPAAAREEILSKVRTTHELLRQQQGFV